MTDRAKGMRRWGYAVWVLLIAGFAVLHAFDLRADFPNGSPWVFDWAKYTDEGWYGSAAVRAHLFGNWYMAGDFNPAVAVPLWPFLEWVLFFFTGVSVEAARGLAVACFFASLALSYLLLRARGPDPHPADEKPSARAPVSHPTDEDLSVGTPVWMALLALTLAVSSQFLYCFSRLAILEPLQTTLTLAALNLAVRLAGARRPRLVSAGIGLLFALAMLTKTTEIFLFPAVGWAIVAALWQRRRLAVSCAAAAATSAAVAYAVWLAIVGALGLMGDYKYYFFVNTYPKPAGWGWPLESFWWSLHGLLWVDHSLIVLAAAVALGAALGWKSAWGRRLWREPLFGCSLWAVAGYVLFMTLQNHPQPRYYAVPAFFCFLLVSLGAGTLLGQGSAQGSERARKRGSEGAEIPALAARTETRQGWGSQPGRMPRLAGWSVLGLAAAAACVHGAGTVRYAMHPEYTLARAAAELTHYIDAHPNGRRLLVSISGDEFMLLTHLPALCDDFGTEDLPAKTAGYRPGWYASWNDLDPGTLEDLHMHFSLEQVAAFRALDDPERNLLVLFKLHPLQAGTRRDPEDPAMKSPLPDDKIDVPVE